MVIHLDFLEPPVLSTPKLELTNNRFYGSYFYGQTGSWLDFISWRGEKSAILLAGGEKNPRFKWLAGRKIRNFIGWRGEKSSISLAGGEKNPRFLLDGGEKNSQTKCVDTKFGPKKNTY